MDRIPVSVIATMAPDRIEPMRIKYEDQDGAHVIKVDRILQRDKQLTQNGGSLFKSTTHSWKCETIRDELLVPFRLTYNSENCRWYMYI